MKLVCNECGADADLEGEGEACRYAVKFSCGGWMVNVEAEQDRESAGQINVFGEEAA